jgi:hypothetical protein
MQEHFVRTTTRRIRPSTSKDFERVWRPDPYPQGLRWARLRAICAWSTRTCEREVLQPLQLIRLQRGGSLVNRRPATGATLPTNGIARRPVDVQESHQIPQRPSLATSGEAFAR